MSVPPGMVAAPGMAHVARGAVLGAGTLVHESAYVDDGAVLGAGTRVWHFCHVLGGAVDAPRCSLRDNGVVKNALRLGDNVKDQYNETMYEGE